MRFALLVITLLGTTSTFAQTHVVLSANSGCPVAFSAQPSNVTTTLWTASHEDARNPQAASEPHTPNSGVRVELTAMKARAIQQAEVVVEFLPPGLRYMPAGGGNLYGVKGTPEQVANKTFFMLGGGTPQLHLASDLLIGPSASVKLLHLMRVDFADGTHWYADHANQCSIEPNRFLRVNSSSLSAK